MPKTIPSLLLSAVLLALPWFLRAGEEGAPPRKNQSAGIRLRRPIAMALADGGSRLLIANRDSGTIAVVDTQGLRNVAEIRVGRRLSDMAATPGGDLLLVSDEEAGEVILLAHRQGTVRKLRRLNVGPGPVSVQLTEDGSLATVACRWSQRLVILDLTAVAHSPGQQALPAAPTILDLPFAPRRQLLLPGSSRLLVADAFAGQLAVVDAKRKALVSARTLSVHNLCGLALDRGRKNLWLTHQMLNSQGHTTGVEIRNGNVLTNNLRKLSLADVLDPCADILRNDRLYLLGDVERGAGDPAEVAESYDGHVLVTLAGVNELAIGRPEEVIWTRLAVGRRPTALVVDRARRRAFVANTFADSISVVDLQVSRVVAEVRLGSPPDDLRPEERGEMLFYDARLSFDSWFSCHSCHPDGHTNGRLNDNFTDGSFGTPKRVLSLLGVKDTGPWAWNGSLPDLEGQVRNSLRSTLQGPAPTAEQVHDLTAFLRTLPAPPSLLTARGALDPESLQRGRHVFSREKCAACHAPPIYTTPRTYDVGLRDEVGGTHFNPPSLRGLSQAGSYFHDNRASTLEEVFTRYRHELAGPLTEEELRDLLHFLGSL